MSNSSPYHYYEARKPVSIVRKLNLMAVNFHRENAENCVTSHYTAGKCNFEKYTFVHACIVAFCPYYTQQSIFMILSLEVFFSNTLAQHYNGRVEINIEYISRID